MGLGHRLLDWMERSRVRRSMARMTVGERVTIKPGLRVKRPRNVTIGHDTRINNDLTLQAHAPVTIGSETMFAARVTILTARHDISLRGLAALDSMITAPVVIGSNCWLGAGVIVCPGVTIGDGAVVGAGSVVTRDLPPNMVCVGVPAKPIRPRPDASKAGDAGQPDDPGEAYEAGV